MKQLKQLLKQPLWLLTISSIIIVTLYWALIASDRYVSQANVVIQTSEIRPPELNFSNMLSGSAASNTSDLLLLRDYLLSVDMLKILDQELGLRAHYADSNIDYFSRLTDENVPIEELHEYYLKRVDIYLDDYSKVLRIKASAFNKEVAVSMVEKLLEYGEKKMNQLGQKLAQEQVQFIEKQVTQLSQNLEVARAEVLAYQNQEGMISPTVTVESVSGIIGELSAELSKLKAKKSVLMNFQSERSSEMIKLSSEIAALEKQIQIENSKLTAKQGNALNAVTAEYETLMLRAQFAQELYSNALATLEATRVEAARKLKQLSVLQTATVPDYAIEPNRLYNIAAFALMAFVLSVILSLMLAIVKDHQD